MAGEIPEGTASISPDRKPEGESPDKSRALALVETESQPDDPDESPGWPWR